jgi:hypothetical protein
MQTIIEITDLVKIFKNSAQEVCVNRLAIVV